MWLRRLFGTLKSQPPPSRRHPHLLLAVYSGALSPAVAMRLRLASSVQSAQEPLRE